MNNLADGYGDAGKLDRALPLLEETLALRKAKLGPDHPDTLSSMNNLADGYRPPASSTAHAAVRGDAEKAKLGPDHPDHHVMNNLASSTDRQTTGCRC